MAFLWTFLVYTTDGGLPGSTRIFRLPQVREVTGLGKTMIYRLEAAQRFPKRIKIGLRAVGWLEGDIRDWVLARVQDSQRRASEST